MTLSSSGDPSVATTVKRCQAVPDRGVQTVPQMASARHEAPVGSAIVEGVNGLEVAFARPLDGDFTNGSESSTMYSYPPGPPLPPARVPVVCARGRTVITRSRLLPRRTRIRGLTSSSALARTAHTPRTASRRQKNSSDRRSWQLPASRGRALQGAEGERRDVRTERKVCRSRMHDIAVTSLASHVFPEPSDRVPHRRSRRA